MGIAAQGTRTWRGAASLPWAPSRGCARGAHFAGQRGAQISGRMGPAVAWYLPPDVPLPLSACETSGLGGPVSEEDSAAGFQIRVTSVGPAKTSAA